MERRSILIATGAGAGLVALAAAALLLRPAAPGTAGADDALVGEARDGRVRVDLPRVMAGITISQSKVPGRPIVVIDPGHGGRDPGATGVSGAVHEKDLTLAAARELRDRLVADGRVRVALTRDDDRYLTLEERAAIARQLGAGLFVSIHMDSAPNPLAQGVTVYSLSDVASSAEAARFAGVENGSAALSSDRDGSVRALLADVALRDQMEQSAAFAERVVARAAGVQLRPRPHQFAAFHVLRRTEVPALLVEAGYVSNVDDEKRLSSPEGRAPLIRALASAIEADVATRTAR
ncbi:N-acetylmuramoyl-L-alanine amidase [Sphingomonas sp. ASV193]|uniref:N-acetylmuramoyl-L-alanine amidase family protein n=1 Tax=Sphingomonas sp. ASV193 TaxID=3144405 RepID=UPI0032E8F6D5